MIIHRGSYTHDIPDSAIIVRGDSFYAPVDMEVRGRTLRQYIPFTPPVVKSPFDSGMLYDQPQPYSALAIWRPTIEVPITQLGYYREGSRQKAIPGLSLTMCNVRIVLTLPEAA